MNDILGVLDDAEKNLYKLRSLYRSFGYSRYNMSKFEEYDLYSKNKDFLVSDGVITFTDTNGKLMALKPDVTLSIIKNHKDKKGQVEKLYYNENVYRVSKGTGSFKEIMQCGLECIGDIDTYCIGEVLSLSLRSLCAVSDDFILEVSDLNILSHFIDAVTVDVSLQKELLKLVGEKNLHGISALCSENELSKEATDRLLRLLNIFGTPFDVITELRRLCGDEISSEIDEFESQILPLCEFYNQNIRVDFSLVGTLNYYNGIVFKGFVNGIPDAVLSGGRYDKLLKKLGKKSGAIGFAVYLDMLEMFNRSSVSYDFDTMLVYGNEADTVKIADAVNKLRESGESVLAVKTADEKVRVKRTVNITDF